MGCSAYGLTASVVWNLIHTVCYFSAKSILLPTCHGTVIPNVCERTHPTYIMVGVTSSISIHREMHSVFHPPSGTLTNSVHSYLR